MSYDRNSTSNPRSSSSSESYQNPSTLFQARNSEEIYAQQQQQQQQTIQLEQQQGIGGMHAGDDEYNRLLKNYKLAHERIELQRLQMLEQEKQNAILRKHVALLEGGDTSSISTVNYTSGGGGGSTIDDFTIRNCSSSLARRINRWAADTITVFTRDSKPGEQHLALIPLAAALYADVQGKDSPFLLALEAISFNYPRLAMVVQNLMRHLMSEVICYSIVNQVLTTNSEDANKELTRVHEELFNRQPLIASVWLRHTFSAAIDQLTDPMKFALIADRMPSVFELLNPGNLSLDPDLGEVVETSYTFSRMLHSSASPTGGGGMDSSGYYRAFVPHIGTVIDPGTMELTKRCRRIERGESETVGACLFPGMNKTIPFAKGNSTPVGVIIPSDNNDVIILLVRRAQVICECAMAA